MIVTLPWGLLQVVFLICYASLSFITMVVKVMFYTSLDFTARGHITCYTSLDSLQAQLGYRYTTKYTFGIVYYVAYHKGRKVRV